MLKKLEKKENEVKKLKDKMSSGLMKNIRKIVKKAKKTVRRHVPGIG